MKSSLNFQPRERFYRSDHKENCLQSFQGNTELVKFPSTSEVFHAVLENPLYASFLVNSKGKTLEANETVCKVFGYTTKEITILTIKELFDTSEKKYIDYLYQCRSYRRAKAQITAIRKGGERFPCEITSLMYIDEDGEKKAINTILDISKNYSNLLFE